MRTTLSRLLAILLLVALGCREPPLDVPEPDLSRADPEVAEQVREAVQQARRELAGSAPSDQRAQSLGELGEICHAHDFPDCARTAYLAAAQLEPRQTRWPYLLGWLELEQERPEPALAAFDRAVALDASAVLPRLGAAAAAVAAGEAATAEQSYRAVLDLSSRQATALFGLGKLLLDRAESEPSLLGAALELLQAAQREAPGADAIHHALARLERLRGNHRAAAMHARQAGASTPPLEDPDLARVQRRRTGTHNLAARAQREVLAGKLVDAVATYRSLLASQPSDVRARVNLASVLVQLGRLDSARSELATALQLAPGDPGALFNLGTLELVAGRFDDAAAALDQALAGPGATPEMALNRGVVAWSTGELTTAQAMFQQATGGTRHPLEAWRWLLATLVRAGETDRASEVVNLALGHLDAAQQLALEGDRVRIHIVRASQGRSAADTALARARVLAASAEDAPSTASTWEVWRSCALAAAAAGDWERATGWQIRAIRAAVRTSPAGATLLRAELDRYRQRKPSLLRWWQPGNEVTFADALPGPSGGRVDTAARSR
jgi:tetratricopeptide (TPR) repeat protein